MGSTGSSSRQAGKLRPTSAENCECQCNKDHPTFREDERRCVNELPGKFYYLTYNIFSILRTHLLNTINLYEI